MTSTHPRRAPKKTGSITAYEGRRERGGASRRGGSRLGQDDRSPRDDDELMALGAELETVSTRAEMRSR